MGEEFGDVGGVEDLAQAGVGDVLAAKEDVFADGFVEEEGVLRDDREEGAQVGEGHGGGWDAADGDLP